MTVGDVLRRGITVLAIGGLLSCPSVGTAFAQPGPEPQPVPVDAPVPVAAPLPPDGVPPPPPVDEGHVESTPPAVTDTPDGWQLTLSAKDETQAPDTAAHHRVVVARIRRRRHLQRLAEGPRRR